jgi:diadenosine tetraphosphate (Ap4A) HIT family hydrolase
MVSLRTTEGKKKYKEYLSTHPQGDVCDLCGKEPIEEFEGWKIVLNSFPYDQIAETHHMLALLRHATEEELTETELVELKTIKATYVNDNYDWIIEATTKNKSIPAHFHLHLIVGRKQ